MLAGRRMRVLIATEDSFGGRVGHRALGVG